MILHTQVTLDRNYGGPARTVPALCRELSELTATGLVSHLSDESELADIELKQATFYATDDRSRGAFFRRITACDSIELIHDHGLWLPNNIASYNYAQKASIPFVLSTRGMLTPWALRHKWLKKRVAWYAYQKKILKRVDLFHATAPSEAQDLRALGFTQPICVIPNGVDFPTTMPTAQPQQKKTLLFLSRIHPKKGVDMLLDVWSEIASPEWQLQIAGSGDEQYMRALHRKIEQQQIGSVEFIGELSDSAKWQAYVNADIFVLPTHSENFGVVVAEAMAAELPAITTTGAPWQLLQETSSGWWIENSPSALTAALREAMQLDDTQRRAMGMRGCDAAHKQFGWSSIATKMHAVYRWLLDGSTKPSTII